MFLAPHLILRSILLPTCVQMISLGTIGRTEADSGVIIPAGLVRCAGSTWAPCISFVYKSVENIYYNDLSWCFWLNY